MEELELKSLAKINLGLDVLGKRPDGYHDVRMVMQTVWLFDRVCLRKRQDSKITLSSNLHFLPTGEKNIAYQAANRMMEQFHLKDGIDIRLKKSIPVAAGLAGGSGNAAAVLFGMNQLFHLGLSQEELMEIGLDLGADVPYCLMRGTVLAEGIGEQLTRVPKMPKCFILLAKPPISVSTKQVYEALDSSLKIEHPDIDGLLKALEEQNVIMMTKAMGNVLEPITKTMYPCIATIEEEMYRAGALKAMMSGSGPTVFGIFEKRSDAVKAKRRIQNRGLARQAFVTNLHRVKEEK